MKYELFVGWIYSLLLRCCYCCRWSCCYMFVVVAVLGDYGMKYENWMNRIVEYWKSDVHYLTTHLINHRSRDFILYQIDSFSYRRFCDDDYVSSDCDLSTVVAVVVLVSSSMKMAMMMMLLASQFQGLNEVFCWRWRAIWD